MTRLLEQKIEFPYKRSLGPVLGRYVAELGRGRLMGARSGGRVLFPPQEYDPDTSEAVDPDLVEVGPAGVVTSWTWVPTPHARHPLDHPFAFALVRPDGADTAAVHVVDAGDESRMSTGMRVTARFAAEPAGSVRDLVCFVPEGDGPDSGAGVPPSALAAPDAGGGPVEPVARMDFWSSLTYRDSLAPAGERYAEGLLAGRLTGQRCGTCGLVYVPPRDYCPRDGVPLSADDDVALPDRGVVTNFTVVTPIPYPGQKETEPFVRSSILLDDADALLGLQAMVDVANADVRVGMRVSAVWVPEGERRTDELSNRSWGSVTGCITGWRPTGEPDLPAEQFLGRVF